MRLRIGLYAFSFILFAFLFCAANAPAQTVAYRKTDLASNVPGVANNVTPGLVNPFGIAFLTGQPFFVADSGNGHVTSVDATGLGVSPGGFAIPNAGGAGFDHPTGIIADQNSSFGDASLIQPFIVVTDEGTILTWGLDRRGDIPGAATVVVNSASRGAVYKGAAILASSFTSPALAVTDFHGGFIDTFLPGLAPVALPGSFTDPNLPAGYAPFGIQVIGSQVFVTYALQDAAKRSPVVGAGNGVVDIFDMDGNFVRRFATGGTLNAPWGVAQASANFGPFRNDILIGNVGDGTISAFDPVSGQFGGQLLDGDGLPLREIGLHGLAFRADGFGDANTLYFTSQLSSESDGLFGAISTGLVSVTRVSAPNSNLGGRVTITASVAAGPGNAGAPTGTVTFLDGSSPLGTATLLGGSATLGAAFAVAGAHVITAQYGGDGIFLPSSQSISVQVAGLATALTLTAPANAAPGSAVTLTASISSAGGIPTGQVAFLDGATTLGSALLDGTGVAILRVDTLAAGIHSLTASYGGDAKFGTSDSAAVAIDIANADFSLAVTPSSAIVIAGQSTQFQLTLTPLGGFAAPVTFSCSSTIGISCAFNPPSITPVNGTATTMLTVTTSLAVVHFGLLVPSMVGFGGGLMALAWFRLAMRSGRKFKLAHTVFVPAAAAIIFAAALCLAGCGGYGSSTQANRGTASIVVTAQAAAVSHAANISVTVQ